MDNRPVELFTATDPATGFSVEVSDYGATLVRVKTPDRKGVVADINFGQDKPELFPERNAYLGAVVGRVANRIGNAKFTLDGAEYKLFVNIANKHSLHGGAVGFNYKVWDCVSAKVVDGEVRIVFQYVSPDGEEGYPGTLTTKVEYIISPQSLAWEITATTDKTTIIMITNHAYWNLAGLDTVIDDQVVQVNAVKYMPVDENGLVTGEVVDMPGTDIDMKQPKTFKAIFDTYGDIDNNFMLEGVEGKKDPRELVAIGEVYSPSTGRVMKMTTSEPCVQLYSGNFMGDVKSFDVTCKKHSAICFETQHVPNAINMPDLAESVTLRPGDTYYHKTVHTFEVRG